MHTLNCIVALVTIVQFPCVRSELINNEKTIKYKVIVKTGHEWLSGTDSDVYLDIVGRWRNISNINLNIKPEYLEKDSIDIFYKSSKDIGTICGVGLWMNGSDGWSVEYVNASKSTSMSPIHFYFNVWITPETRYQKANPGNWEDWNGWSACRSCDAKKKRQRQCDNGCMTLSCVGSSHEELPCGPHDCKTTGFIHSNTTRLVTANVNTGFPHESYSHSNKRSKEVSFIIPISASVGGVTMLVVVVALSAVCYAKRRRRRSRAGANNLDKDHIIKRSHEMMHLKIRNDAENSFKKSDMCIVTAGKESPVDKKQNSISINDTRETEQTCIYSTPYSERNTEYQDLEASSSGNTNEQNFNNTVHSGDNRRSSLGKAPADTHCLPVWLDNDVYETT